MSNNHDDNPLIYINWRKIIKGLVFVLRKIKRGVELLLMFVLKILTTAVRILHRIYSAIKNALVSFALSRQRGGWIILLFLVTLAMTGLAFSAQQRITILEASTQKATQERTEAVKEKSQAEKKAAEFEQIIREHDEESSLIPILPPAKKPQPTKAPVATPTPTKKVTQAPVGGSTSGYKGKGLYGKVSHYSRAGCLGCSPNLTMANGETLDDSRLTIAVPPGTIPMNTPVRVTNETNGKSVIAMVTDTGGFAKYNRVADLTPAVANALGTQTDISTVRVEPL